MCRNFSMRWRIRNVLKQKAANRVLLGIPLVWPKGSDAPAGSAGQTDANAGGMSGIEGRAIRTSARATGELWREIYENGFCSPEYT